MKLSLKNISGENVINLMRRVGYHFQRKDAEKGELVFVRPLQGVPYPRFHIYLRENKETKEIIINLHLDQKMPRYKGVSAHSGEYEGKVIEEEAERIKNSLNNW